ncbi:flagellar motor switch protein FliN [Vibrio alginolyticus]|uniref:flagellar motor switch protein FliN n=1 Tax=Vibrio sp. B1FLJ16 TaxID=2751178 RepID=UPI0015F4D42D|nr:flagellar motor switch protein FliN [Vibrio sp. B1FLJ16]CAD7821838.1 FliM) that form the rotor-mounted switch complex (C ring) [Vibrio sp. B1FLJ16]CAD7823367.1 FliM) that form the rotor-mounted switch complex (C ring) [Vibrio sp. B1FLJ16]CAE6947327.1 FliM) that form the rotor-mounted switch complex (C ring) [Vibrio sp. B1FLJ16]CAE6951675.1 FliM) that form the rotor-mounted switch complex (C ring) [Vibrio sp. B1FLJ16]
MSESLEQNAFDSEELNFDDFHLEGIEDETPKFTPAVTERDLSFFKNIPVTLTLEVASKEVALADLMKAGEGSVIELDKLNGEPLDVRVNGALMGHAEVVVVNDKYGLRLTSVLDTTLANAVK